MPTEPSADCKTCGGRGYFTDKYGHKWTCFKCEARLRAEEADGR
jgi:hypothetical protein